MISNGKVTVGLFLYGKAFVDRFKTRCIVIWNDLEGTTYVAILVLYVGL